MRKLIIFYMSFMVLYGCKTEEDSLSILPDRIPISISAKIKSVSPSVATRANINEHDEFENGAYIALNVTPVGGDEKKYLYQFDGSEWQSIFEACYYPAGNTPCSITAYYPSSIYGTFSVSNYQTTDAEYRQSDLMYANYGTKQKPTSEAEKTVPLTFNHKMAKIIVNAYTYYGGIYITGIRLMNVKCDIDLNAALNLSTGEVASSDVLDNISEIKVAAQLSDYSLEDMTLSGAALIPPQNIAKGTVFIEVETNYGSRYYKIDDDEGKNFGAGYTYTLNLNIDKLGEDDIIPITNWSDGTPVTLSPTTDQGTPLTIEAKSGAATVTITNPLKRKISYVTVIGGVVNGTYGSGNITVNLLNAGDKVMLFGNNATYCTCTESSSAVIYKETNIELTAPCYVYGNVMSLINAANYESLTELTGDYAFRGFFSGCEYMENHPSKEIVLPATTLTKYCYCNMFEGCAMIERAPELPATTLTAACYYGMFENCKNLLKAPELPATVLASTCYSEMFRNCTSLVTAPKLPATELARMCYYGMFRECSSLIIAPDLPAVGNLEDYYHCYSNMFYSCTNLSYVKAMFVSMTEQATSGWMYHVSSLGTFVKNSAATWTTTGSNGVPEGWTIVYADR